MNLNERALKFHKDNEGKIGLHNKVSVQSSEDLTLAYTPGVAAPCLEIEKDPLTIYDYTAKGNWVAIVTNGTAVLGLGDIGAGAGLPVMEGKAVLFKAFGGVDGFPICIDTKDPEKIIETVKLIEPGFGGINIEDIKAPECFEIEARLKEACDIPVFHDDQHGTAIVVLAGILNALRLVKKDIATVKFVVNGAGSAGISITKLLMEAGAKDMILCDRHGALVEGDDILNHAQEAMAQVTNRDMLRGPLAQVIKGRDIFIGVSAANVLSTEMVTTMNKDSIIFAMANPNPEILPEDALAGGARVVGTGRSDYPNQINNVLVFPGIFRGALDVRSSAISENMKLAAARAISELVTDEDLREDFIIPKSFDKRIAPVVAMEVARAAIAEGLARKEGVTPEWVKRHTEQLIED